MPSFNGDSGSISPATTGDNWTLSANTAGDVGFVTAIGWGGNVTTSAAMRTRWVRPSTIGSGIFTALTEGDSNPGFGTPLCRIGTFGTEPILGSDPAGNLHAVNWNAHGGVGYIALPLSDPWMVIQAGADAQVSCRNASGTSTSNYTVTWRE